MTSIGNNSICHECTRFEKLIRKEEDGLKRAIVKELSITVSIGTRYLAQLRADYAEHKSIHRIAEGIK
jgi:hypothetical protein